MTKNRDDAYEFVMAFVANSQKFKDQYIEQWREVLANFIVTPEDFAGDFVSRPYGKAQDRRIHQSRGIVLKDAETHKAIWTYAAHLVLTLLGDRRGEYVQASPVGWEDTSKAPTVTRLMRYAFGLPGFFRTMVELFVDMLLFGTAVLEVPWRYQEREQLTRTLDAFGLDSFSRQRVVAWDDPSPAVVDNQDFYPDPSEHRIERMCGVAKRFKITALQAMERAESGIYKKSAVDMAVKDILNKGDETRTVHSDEFFRRGLDQPEDARSLDDFTPMIGVEYWGEVPWADDRGSSRRVITIINEQVVRDDPFPLADPDLPFRAVTINPVQGRFYGISPAEVIRWDQSLQDAIKILLAEAIIRGVHPPIAYDIDSEIDLNKLRRFSPDIPIGLRGGPKSIGAIKYDANIFGAFNHTSELKQSMQEASGALSAVQGLGIGVNRASASEAAFTAQQAMTRPELAAALLERDAMPCIAQSLLRRYQQFLEDDDDLQARVGQMPQPVSLTEIMGDFDIRFVGSRIAMSKQEKLQSIDRLVALASAIPPLAANVPWQQIGTWLIGDLLELNEIAANVGDQDVVRMNVLLQMISQQRTGNGNGTTLGQEPQSALPAQMSGGTSGP